MYVVTVVFKVSAENADRFLKLMLANAEASRRTEPGCRQFDVCRDPSEPGTVFLYEVYDDAAAFAAHNRSDHFQTFQAAVQDLVVAKTVSLYPEVWQ
jgi:quinol monooxygenase YgiN